MDLYNGDLGYSTCVMRAQSMMKRQKGGGAFLPNFQESLFLPWNYTLGTNFVPNVLKKVVSVTWLMRYRPIKIKS